MNRFSPARLAALPLVLCLSLAGLVAACGGSGAAAAPSETAPATPAPTTTPEGTEAISATPPLRAAIDPTILSTLKKAGLDVTKLPETLDDVGASETKLSAVMKTFTIALGTTCDGCHEASGSKIDFGAETPRKNVAKRMWKTFVRGLMQTDGAPIYCDSCHQGKMLFLDRADEGALRGWMDENFVAKLARRDGQSHACATCHGEPFDGNFVESWRKN